jgi:DNA ligase-1
MLHCDGELAYDPTAADCLHVTQSHVSSFDKPCETLKFYVFDWCEDAVCNEPYYIRHERLTKFVESVKNPFVEIIPQLHVDSLDELLEAESEYLSQGYEGVMFRNPVGHYKHNRATYIENLIYKLKRFTDSEAIIEGIVEGENNTNARETDARGFSKRSAAKAGMVPNGMVKHFVCRDIKTGEIVHVMPGVLTHPQRKYILEHKEEFIGKILTYRYFGYGVKDRMRFSRFVAFREKWDM